MYVLGIESACDETAAAIVEDGRKLISNVISTSVKEQALYGGDVPEIASRRHAEYISATVDKALADAGMTMADVDAVAVTFAPGLIGAVLVGVNFAKGLAYAAGKPLVPVHHLRGHIAANYLTHQDLKPPFLCLVASGERMARNTPIQGTAADIIKLAMVHVWQRLRDEKLQARLLLQVHDELIGEAPDEEIDEVKRILKEEMENVVHYSVPLTTEVGVGKTWLEAH